MAEYEAERRFWVEAEVSLEVTPTGLVFKVSVPGRRIRRFGTSDLKSPFSRPFGAVAVRRILEKDVAPHLVRLRAQARKLELKSRSSPSTGE